MHFISILLVATLFSAPVYAGDFLVRAGVSTCELLLNLAAQPNDEVLAILSSASPHLSPERIKQIYKTVPIGERQLDDLVILSDKLNAKIARQLPKDPFELMRLQLDIAALEADADGIVSKRKEYDERDLLLESHSAKSGWSIYRHMTGKLWLSTFSASTGIIRRAVESVFLQHEPEEFQTEAMRALIGSYKYILNDELIDEVFSIDPSEFGDEERLEDYYVPVRDRFHIFMGVSPTDDETELRMGWDDVSRVFAALDLPVASRVLDFASSSPRQSVFLARHYPALNYTVGAEGSESFDNSVVFLPLVIQPAIENPAPMLPSDTRALAAVIAHAEAGESFRALCLRGSKVESALRDYAEQHPGTMSVNAVRAYDPLTLIVVGSKF